MWFFRSPQIIFGEDALSFISQVEGRCAFVVTDANIQQLGMLDRVTRQLEESGKGYQVFAEVEPDPSIGTVIRCAEQMAANRPDLVIGLGGGSCLDAAKAAWLLYERPDLDLHSVNALEWYGLRAKARLLNIPTTAGSGAEVTAAAVITDTEEGRKLEVNSFELVADYSIIDPSLTRELPASLTAETGIDVLAHAVEGFASTWANDFSDGLCLQAASMVFTYLPRAVAAGAADLEAREKMANAASIAALGMSNSHISLAHSLAHAAGTLFHLPHGRLTGLFLPYAIEFTANGGAGRYKDIARILDLGCEDETQSGYRLAEAVRDLERRVGLPVTFEQAGITRQALEAQMEVLVSRAEMDIALFTSLRIPVPDEIKKLYQYAFEGMRVDF